MPRTRTAMNRSRSKNWPSAFDELVQLHPPRVIQDETAYENTQEVVDGLTNLVKLTGGQSEYLETLSVLMESYEQEHHAIEIADLSPLETLKYLMTENELKSTDLGRIIGSASAASMILNSERELSKAHIRALAGYFGVDASLFL